MSIDDFTATTYKSLGYLRAVDTLIYNIQSHILVYEVADILGILQYKCHVSLSFTWPPNSVNVSTEHILNLYPNIRCLRKKNTFHWLKREFHKCKKEKKNWKAKAHENVWIASTEPMNFCGIFSGSISHLFVDTQTRSISSILMSYIHFIHHFQSFILHQCFCLITSLCNGLLSSCQKDFQQISVFSWHSIFWKKAKVAQNFDNAKRSTIVVSQFLQPWLCCSIRSSFWM